MRLLADNKSKLASMDWVMDSEMVWTSHWLSEMAQQLGLRGCDQLHAVQQKGSC